MVPLFLSELGAVTGWVRELRVALRSNISFMVQSLGREDPLEKDMATLSSMLA